MTAGGLRFEGGLRRGALQLDLAIDVGPGETLAVLGPNGAGKTTLLRCICGLERIDSGSLELDGEVLAEAATGRHTPPEERSLGVVFQDLLLFEGLDVAGNVAFGPRAAGVSRRRARATALEWLDRLGLAHLAAAAPRELSGGEAQRVALARALAGRPRGLLLDEPLAALDVDVRAEVRRTLRDHLALHEGPCLVVTHDPLDAAVLADRVVVLEDGRVTASGTLAELVARPRTAWGAELAGTNLLPVTSRGGRLEAAGGAAVVAAVPPPEGPALVAVRPAAVTLHRQHPEGSARNVWHLQVAEVEGIGDRKRVRLEGDVSLVAEITDASVRELHVRPGERLWAAVKATDVVAYPA